MEHIVIASDHGGFALRQQVSAWLRSAGVYVEDLGCPDEHSVDYPDYAALVAQAILEKRADRGVLVCGTGIGMSIAANRFPGIRATLVHDVTTARLCRAHNDSNVLVLGGRVTGPIVAEEIVATWLATPFEGGRHQGRLDKADRLGRS